jgi:CPA1 family monovalent cation:H+ antiporter
MNDASGLVTFKFALAAAVTGVFSLANASVTFLLVAIGGLAIGGVKG